MNQGDLRKGMYLNNDGPGVIRVFDDLDFTKEPVLLIQPDQLIGQIVDFKDGSNGYAIVFVSDAITSSLPFLEKAYYYLNPLLWGTLVKLSGVVPFSDIQKYVRDSQVKTQSDALNLADANGNSLSNGFKQVTKGITDAVEDAIPWNLVLIGLGVYVVTHWNNFVKPANIKK